MATNGEATPTEPAEVQTPWRRPGGRGRNPNTNPNPARGYTRQPFQPGNLVPLTHGAKSPRKVNPLAAEILEEAVRVVDWWGPEDMAAARSWARCEARIELLADWLHRQATEDDPGDLTADGEIRAAADLLTRLENQASSLRSKLGLDPLSRARLGADVARSRLDLARMWATEGEEEDPGT